MVMSFINFSGIGIGGLDNSSARRKQEPWHSEYKEGGGCLSCCPWHKSRPRSTYCIQSTLKVPKIGLVWNKLASSSKRTIANLQNIWYKFSHRLLTNWISFYIYPTVSLISFIPKVYGFDPLVQKIYYDLQENCLEWRF